MKLYPSKEPEGEAICASCGVQVEANEKELMGANLLYWKVYRCQRCLHRRQMWALGMCALFVIVIILSALVTHWM